MVCNCDSVGVSRNEFKRDGAGRGNWGTTEDEIPP